MPEVWETQDKKNIQQRIPAIKKRMAETLTPSQRSNAIRQARKIMRVKLQSEKAFIRDLKSYFAKVRRSVASGSQTPSIEPILEKHYKRCVRNLTGIRMKQDEENDYGLEDAIAALLAGRAIRQAGIIDGTTEKYIRESIQEARDMLIAEGVENPADSAINRTASNIFRRKNGGRAGNIATFETQAVTEGTKDALERSGERMMEDSIMEGDRSLGREAADRMGSQTAREVADDIGRVDNSELFAAMAVLMHTWVTMGDSKVRPTHQAAAFQTVPRNEPFMVGGYSLMYPGDTSLGAPMGEVANCRCVEVVL